MTTGQRIAKRVIKENKVEQDRGILVCPEGPLDLVTIDRQEGISDSQFEQWLSDLRAGLASTIDRVIARAVKASKK